MEKHLEFGEKAVGWCRRRVPHGCALQMGFTQWLLRGEQQQCSTGTILCVLWSWWRVNQPESLPLGLSCALLCVTHSVGSRWWAAFPVPVPGAAGWCCACSLPWSCMQAAGPLLPCGTWCSCSARSQSCAGSCHGVSCSGGLGAGLSSSISDRDFPAAESHCGLCDAQR